MAAAAVKASDVVLIPVQPSPYDVWATADLVDIIKARQAVAGAPKAAFLISRAIKNTKLGREVYDALLEYGLPVFKSHTSQLVIYPTSAAKGLTVFSQPGNPATTEIVSIVKELEGFIKQPMGSTENNNA